MRPVPATDEMLLGLDLDEIFEEHEHAADGGRYDIHSLPRGVEKRLRTPLEK